MTIKHIVFIAQAYVSTLAYGLMCIADNEHLATTLRKLFDL